MKPTRSNAATASSRRFPWGVAVGIIVVLAAGASAIWYGLHPPVENTSPSSDGFSSPADPPFESPYLNTKSSVRYVGDAACAPCHAPYCEAFHQHPMGRSIVPVGEVASLDAHVRAGGNPFEARGLRYSVERRGSGLVHKETARDPGGRVVAETTAPVEYVIGSGTHAYSYLFDRDGVLTQSPITWFTQKDAFDLSPGFRAMPDRFGRTVVPACLFCHANHADPLPDAVNRYRSPVFQGYAIGCERCHGPGELHVAERGAKKAVAGETDLTIVNPATLPPKLRDDVCAQCHLGGKERVLRRGKGAFDYRPGLPLDAFWRVLVSPPELASGHRVAGHVEQMTASVCFLKSNGAFGCTSCHDPHTVPAAAEREKYYRDKCLACHETKACGEPLPARSARTKGDDCTVCHMPRGATTTNHVALVDHRILRRPPDQAALPKDPDPVAVTRALVPFGRGAPPAADPESARDVAVAQIVRARLLSETYQREIGRTCLPVLERAVQRHPDDLTARECYAVALAMDGQYGAALAECETTLAAAPNRELSLVDAALVAKRMDLVEKSLGYWRRALAVNPSSSLYRAEVAAALAARSDWPAAVDECRKVLASNAGYVPARRLLLQYFLKAGLKDRAKDELAVLLALHPPDEAVLRQQFAELAK